MKLRGQICLNKRIRQHAIWEHEPYTYAQAWLDLLLLANDRDRTLFIRGERVEVKRGQLAWSLRKLEDEWKRSEKWIGRFLEFCQDETMITVKSDRRGTIITILNYDVYNTIEEATDDGTEEGSDAGTEEATDDGTEEGQKGEKGIGSRKGEEPPPICSLIPTDSEVQEFCAHFSEPTSGIEGIPEQWWTGWLASRLEDTRRIFPRDWKRALTLAFRSDWAARHPKALGLVKKNGAEGFQKNAATSPAQALFLLDRELSEVNAEIQSLDELNQPLPAELRQRRRNLETKRAALGPSANE